MPTTKLAIHGAAGRMGKRLVALSAIDPQLELVAALESADHPDAGKDAGLLAGVDQLSIPLTDDLAGDVAVIVDFSVPAAVPRVLEIGLANSVALVLGTTDLDETTTDSIHKAAKRIPIVWAPSMSLAVNLTMKLTQMAAAALNHQSSGVDIEIIERHHRFKQDAPSGTALKFGQLIADVMHQSKHTHGRSGRPGERPRDEIGYHAVRVGDNPGEHTIVFGMLGETLELSVKASSRDCYALGALTAAKFVAGRPAGLYTMFDVLGLS